MNRLGRPVLHPVEDGMKVCSRCGVAMPVSAFGRTPQKQFLSACLVCLARVSRTRYQSDPRTRQMRLAATTDWIRRNPERRLQHTRAYQERLRAARLEAPAKPPRPRRGTGIEGQKCCTGCRQWMEFSCFGKQSGTRSGYTCRCLLCTAVDRAKRRTDAVLGLFDDLGAEQRDALVVTILAKILPKLNTPAKTWLAKIAARAIQHAPNDDSAGPNCPAPRICLDDQTP